MNLNLKKFKKVSGDKDHTMMRHEDGHEMKIVHKGLSKANRKALDELPMFADGGTSGDPSSQVGDYKTSQPKPKPSSQPEDPHAWTKSFFPFSETASPKKMADGGSVDDIIAKKKEVDDYNNLHEDEPKEYPQDVEVTMQKTDVTPQKKADGGPVSFPTTTKNLGGVRGYKDGDVIAEADGGVIPGNPMQGHEMHGDKPAHAIKRTTVGEIKRKMYADGTDDTPVSQDPPAPPAPAATAQDATSPPVDDTQQKQVTAFNDKVNNVLNSSAPQTPDASAPNLPEGYQQQIKGIQGQADAESKAARLQADVYANQLGEQAKFNAESQARLQKLNTEHDSLMQEVRTGKIDPSRYINDKSLPGKISTAIGLVLGGIGGGLQQNGKNAALDFLNANIDRDIDGQKANLGKTQSLLDANMKEHGNLLDAMAATKAQMLGMTQMQLQQAANAAQSPAAKARAMQMAGQLQQQIAPAYQQLAIRQQLMDQSKAPGGNSLDPMDYARMGVLEPTQAEKEQASVDKQRNTVGQINKLYDELAKQQTLSNRVMNPLQSRARIGALNSQLTNLIMDADVSKRLTPESAKLEVHPNEVGISDDAKTVETKRRNLLAIAKQKASGGAPFTEKYSPSALPDYSGSNTMEKALLKAALANPNHPNSAAIIKKFGQQQ